MRSDARRWRAWLALGLWAAFVLNLGGDGFAHSQTSRLLGPLLEWLLPDASPVLLEVLLKAIRKTAHIAVYGILGVLALRAAWLTWPGSKARAIAFGLSFVVLLAVGDEARQAGSAARTGSEWDLLLDAAGAALAIWAVFALPARFRASLLPAA